MVPLWDWLIASCEVDLVVDAHDPSIILGWAVQSGPEVLHSVGVKRSMVEAGFAQEILAELLGDVGAFRCCTLETPQFTSRKTADALGDRPQSWALDPSWLAVRAVRR